MFRALLLAGVFLLISPALRGYFLGVLEYMQQTINLHSTAAMVVTGVAVFCSFLGLQMTSQK